MEQGKEELITHLTMVIGRQFSHWSCKLGYFNLSFVVPLEASKKNLSLSWFHTWNNDLKKRWNKINHLFTPPAAHYCLCGTTSFVPKTFSNEIKPSIGCPAKEKKGNSSKIIGAKRRESRRERSRGKKDFTFCACLNFNCNLGAQLVNNIWVILVFLARYWLEIARLTSLVDSNVNQSIDCSQAIRGEVPGTIAYHQPSMELIVHCQHLKTK